MVFESDNPPHPLKFMLGYPRQDLHSVGRTAGNGSTAGKATHFWNFSREESEKKKDGCET